ncbi:monovalent cation:proton antiporter family protein [Bacillus safensis]|uniref:monovalent cation:proton antiporter family protein n=1 Tax=Bacillus safensis TaxID=561879 RepID=UPI0022372FEB|nr:monovalent cation:proton antiporter family protein [Bacillus safensis]MCW4644619.1 monovalent cation:proton antiporter family protein [Bacillus safensis]MCY7564369.1 monovalent cation:proton antiporter family protein [Bacillus safensis]MCY7625345.1 monovalent cation:proton antiporter family protein [Bacillus safensis]MCY7633681.1 monovalent cation:proton antiporter family protein [Bacillus safensis]MCY7650290.1 monovalent cation:proton antiporter family protein [Bacillus safensis]
MEHTSVSSLVVVIIVAFFTPILLHRFKLTIPVVVAEIIMGLIIGKSGLQLVVEHDAWLDTLSMLGFIFLMFLSGLEIDFSSFESKKKARELPNGLKEPNTFKAATIIFLGVFCMSFILSYAFVLAGFIQNAFLMTLIISTISLGVVVPTLKEEKLMQTNIGQIILLVAVIADLVTMILLAVFSSIYGDGTGNMWLLLLLFAAGILLYLFGRVFKTKSIFQSMSKGTVQIGTRAIFTLIIVLVALSESLGAENILGAFLAGVLVSLLSPNKELVQQLDSFGYGFLIPIFFVMVGVDLNIWALFKDPTIMIMIPLLFIALLMSKLIPILYLKKWYDMKKVIGSGFLLTSTLSLVIAAATIGERLGVIDHKMSGALILVAVLTSILTPVWFKALFKKEQAASHKKRVTFIGANQLTLPVTLDLHQDEYDIRILHVFQENKEALLADSIFEVESIEQYDDETLRKAGVSQEDVLVVATGSETKNKEIALFAKEEGAKQVIASVNKAEAELTLKEAGIDTFSTFLSSKTVLRALIEAPDAIRLLTNEDSSLYQIQMNNHRYHNVMLREFPFTGDLVFVRIFRGVDSLVPHGDTTLRSGDRVLVSGSREYVAGLRAQLE